MGQADRILRVIAAVVIGVLIYNGVIQGTLAYVLGALAVIFLATSLVRFCPLYLPIKLDTGGDK